MDQRFVWDSIAEEWSRYRKKPFAEVAEIVSGMSGLILDLGCGSGRNFIAGKNIISLDFSECMLRLSNCPLIIQADVSCLPAKDGMFDSILAVAVFHCVPEWKRAISEAYRALKPGGRMLVTVFDYEQENFKGMNKELIKNWGGYERYYYLFSQKELEQELRNAGFNILKSSKFASKFAKRPKGLFWNLLVLAEKRP